MRRFLALIVVTILVTPACAGDSMGTPSAPTPLPASGGRGLQWAGPQNIEQYVVATFERGITSRVTEDDFKCVPVAGPYFCQGFLVTMPADGLLLARMAWTPVANPYPLDFDIHDPEERQRWDSMASAVGERRVEAMPVKAGVTYPITIWSAYVPGEEFELRFSIW